MRGVSTSFLFAQNVQNMRADIIMNNDALLKMKNNFEMKWDEKSKLKKQPFLVFDLATECVKFSGKIKKGCVIIPDDNIT